MTDESSLLLQKMIVLSTNFEFKVVRSVSKLKSLPLLLFVLWASIFDMCSIISLFFLTGSCFRNLNSYSKDFIIPMLLLSKSFSFCSSFMKILICGISSPFSSDFRVLKKSALGCIQVRSFPLIEVFFWKNLNHL